MICELKLEDEICDAREDPLAVKCEKNLCR